MMVIVMVVYSFGLLLLISASLAVLLADLCMHCQIFKMSSSKEN